MTRVLRFTTFFLSFSLVLGASWPADSEAITCVVRKLGTFVLRTNKAARPPAFLQEMKPENLDWVLETVRTPYEATAEHVLERGFQAYLRNSAAAVRRFDKLFRSGQLSSKLRDELQAEHLLLVKGEKAGSIYVGTTIPTFKSDLPARVQRDAGTFIHQQGNLVLSEATLVLRKSSPSHPGIEWLGPGPDLIPPPNLPEPFPKNGETWELWFPEIAEKAKAKNIDPKLVMPKNFNSHETIQHKYPRFYYQELYLDRMSDLMKEIENCLLRSCPGKSNREILNTIADYYQTGINAHLFLRVNNSLLMNQVNYLLRYMDLKGISHEALDYLALYKVPGDFREAFIRAVERRNPGLL